MVADLFVAAPLPPSCPPSDAKPFNDEVTVLRLVATNPPTVEDFEPNSKNANKICPKFGDKCRWAGISVWSEAVKREDLMGITKLPKNSHLKYLARVKVNGRTGLVSPHKDKETHLTCWAYQSYDFTSAIEAMEQINDKE